MGGRQWFYCISDSVVCLGLLAFLPARHTHADNLINVFITVIAQPFQLCPDLGLCLQAASNVDMLSSSHDLRQLYRVRHSSENIVATTQSRSPLRFALTTSPVRASVHRPVYCTPLLLQAGARFWRMVFTLLQ